MVTHAFHFIIETVRFPVHNSAHCAQFRMDTALRHRVHTA